MIYTLILKRFHKAHKLDNYEQVLFFSLIINRTLKICKDSPFQMVLGAPDTETTGSKNTIGINNYVTAEMLNVKNRTKSDLGILNFLKVPDFA